MSDEKRERWAPPGSGFAGPEIRTGDDNGGVLVPVHFFPSMEARDAAMRDLEAMAALRLHGGGAVLVGHGAEGWSLLGSTSGDQLCTTTSDPADAILAALGDHE